MSSKGSFIFLWLLPFFSLSLLFSRFTLIQLSEYIFYHVCRVRGLLNLWLEVFHQFWKVLNHYHFQIASASFPPSLSSWTLVMYTLDLLPLWWMLLHSPLFCLFPFYLSASFWIFSLHLSSDSLVLSLSSGFNLLLNPSVDFLICHFVSWLWNFHWIFFIIFSSLLESATCLFISLTTLCFVFL